MSSQACPHDSDNLCFFAKFRRHLRLVKNYKLFKNWYKRCLIASKIRIVIEKIIFLHFCAVFTHFS